MKRSILISCFAVLASFISTRQGVAQIFTTIDPPLYNYGGAGAIEDQNILVSSTHAAYIYNGSTYKTVEDTDITSTPDYQYEGEPILTGISGDIIVGFYIGFGSNGREYQSFVDNNGVFSSFSDPLGTRFTFLTGVSGNILFGFSTDNQNNFEHGFLYQNGVFSDLPYAPAGISGGEIVGNENGQAFLFSGGSSSVIAYPGASSTIVAEIDGNEIVGSYTLPGNSADHAFLLVDGTFFNLDDPLAVDGTQLDGVSGNTAVGEYYDTNAIGHAFEVTFAVPEPFTFVLLGLGLVPLIGFQRIRRGSMASN